MREIYLRKYSTLCAPAEAPAAKYDYKNDYGTNNYGNNNYNTADQVDLIFNILDLLIKSCYICYEIIKSKTSFCRFSFASVFFYCLYFIIDSFREKVEQKDERMSLFIYIVFDAIITALIIIFSVGFFISYLFFCDNQELKRYDGFGDIFTILSIIVLNPYVISAFFFLYSNAELMLGTKDFIQNLPKIVYSLVYLYFTYVYFYFDTSDSLFQYIYLFFILLWVFVFFQCTLIDKYLQNENRNLEDSKHLISLGFSQNQNKIQRQN